MELTDQYEEKLASVSFRVAILGSIVLGVAHMCDDPLPNIKDAHFLTLQPNISCES